MDELDPDVVLELRARREGIVYWRTVQAKRQAAEVRRNQARLQMMRGD